MKLLSKAAFIALCFLSESYYSQSDYSVGITVGTGMNIYKNDLSDDRSHFNTKTPVSFYFGGKLVKNLDEENKLFADLSVTRKK